MSTPADLDDAGDEPFIFRAIADYTYDWESWIGVDGSTRWVNPAVERITGYSVEECLRREDYPFFLVHPEDRTRIADALFHARRHISGNDLEFRILHKEGFVRWGAISWQDLYDRENRYRGFRTSVRDITARKAAEGEILRSRDEAHRANQAKSEFLAHMSHEIRTPIQNILGCAQLLQATALDARQERFLSVVMDQSEVLLKIVDDILDFSVLQSTTLRLEDLPFSVHEAARAVVEAARPAATAKGLALRVELGPGTDLVVRGDVHRLRQVLGNLVGNAVKFTEVGEVYFGVFRDGEADPASPSAALPVRLRFLVRDTGIGMRPEQMGNLFQPFVQGDASIARRFGGSGLGLSICKRLVELMGGSIEVESTPGVGSTFFTTLAFARAPRGVDTPSAGPPVVSARQLSQRVPLRILVVEDTNVARDVQVELLRALGQSPDSVSSGAEALAALTRSTYDVVLMDERMPGMDGLSLTRRIRRDSTIRQPYIVAVTANVLPEARAACLEAGMDAFLGKPVRLADLAKVLEDVAGRRDVARARDTGAFAEWFERPVLEQLLVRGADGRTVLERSLAMIVLELEKESKALVTLAKRGNRGALGRKAHAIRGSLRAIGSTRAAEQAAELEAAAKNERLTDLRTRAEAVRAAVGATAAALQAFAADNGIPITPQRT